MKPLALYQIIIILVAVVMLIQGTAAYLQKERNQSFLKFLTRLIVWGGMIAIVALPDFTLWLSRGIGIDGNKNAVVLTGFLFVFLILFKLLSTLENLEHQITALVRKDALEKITPKK
jgi:hypothetical protein